MSNENKMVEDVNSDLSPQYYNPDSGQYEYLHGADGVSFTGNHVLTESGLWVPQSGTSDGAVRTQLIGSNVEQDVIIAGGKRDEITILPRQVRQSGTVNETFSIPAGVSSILFVHVVYQVSGSFDSEEGHRFLAAPYEGSTGRVLFGSLYDYQELMDFHTTISSISNGSYSFMFNPYAEEMLNPRKDVLMKMPVVFNDMRLSLYIEGEFAENEGIDSEVICRFNYN